MRYIFLVIFAVLVASCATSPVTPLEYKYHEFNAPIGEILSVETGEDLFVRGSYIQGEIIDIPQEVSKLIPGALGIPFPITIGSGILELKSISGGWKYFCGSHDNVSASFPGLGSVIAKDDCVGIRVSGNKVQWVVDNSIHNRMKTVYARNLNESEIALYKPQTNGSILKALDYEKIVFEGFYGGQVHFAWERLTNSSRDTRGFTFDFDGTPTIVGIKGQQFRIEKVNNIALEYEWIRIKSWD